MFYCLPYRNSICLYVSVWGKDGRKKAFQTVRKIRNRKLGNKNHGQGKNRGKRDFLIIHTVEDRILYDCKYSQCPKL